MEITGRNWFSPLSSITVPIFTKRRPVGVFFCVKSYNECREHQTVLVTDTRLQTAGRVSPCKRFFFNFNFIYLLLFAIRVGSICPHRSE